MPRPRTACRILSQCLAGLAAIAAVSANCYYPNGTDRNTGLPEDIYFPVNTGDEFSMCCSKLGDKPRSDGLCENKDGSVTWRESCTDRTWQSPHCIKLCADPNTPDTNEASYSGPLRQSDNDEQVTPCTDGSYCCGDGALGSDCCNDGRGVFIRDGTTQKENPTPTASDGTSSATASASTPTDPTTASPASESSPAPSLESGSNVGAIVGGVIGGLAGLLLILAAPWFFVFRKRRSKAMQSSQSSPQYYTPEKPQLAQETHGSYLEDYRRTELEGGRVSKVRGRSEMDAYSQPDAKSPSTQMTADDKAELV